MKTLVLFAGVLTLVCIAESASEYQQLSSLHRKGRQCLMVVATQTTFIIFNQSAAGSAGISILFFCLAFIKSFCSPLESCLFFVRSDTHFR